MAHPGIAGVPPANHGGRDARPPFDRFKEHIPLAPHTTIAVGGNARYFLAVHDITQLREALDWAGHQRLPVFILGGGSNIVFPDEELNALVIQIALKAIWESAAADTAGTVLATAAAGEDWDAFVAWTVERGWAGIECLSGIPGCAGATPIQNVGAYGQEVAETIASVTVLDRHNDATTEIPGEECAFGYRTSRFKTIDRGCYIVLSVTFRLVPGGKPAVRYHGLETYLAKNGIRHPTLRDVREAVLAVRRSKAMVVDHDEPNSRGCGSFFMNPIMSAQQFVDIRATAERAGVVSPGDTIPAHSVPDGRLKLSAAWLIERAGLRRGFHHGGAGISEKHSLAIVNFGGATARDVTELAALVIAHVMEKFGVRLQPEPLILAPDGTIRAI
ncbi:MAG: UDP-N-acetylmuramate dehydrogenase [bacterium]